MKWFWPLILVAIVSPKSWAYDPVHEPVTGEQLPKELESLGVTAQLGSKIDEDLEFTDDHGQPVTLKRYFHSNRPVIMAMVYYTCPGLCNYHLNALTEAMKKLKWTSGNQFELVAVSMNSAETADLASKKKASYLKEYARPNAEDGWHFLVGAKGSVEELAKDLGFHYRYLADKKQFAHPSVTYILTPEGEISRYIDGIQIEPNTLKLGLLEASGGKIGSFVDQALMFCFQFDPHKKKYVLYAWNIMRIGGILMVLLLAAVLIPVWWREFHLET